MKFAGAGTEDVYNGKASKAARSVCPPPLVNVARRKLDQLAAVETVIELRRPPGNKLEALSGDRKGQYSIRINERYRICFTWENDEPENIEIVDYH